MKVTPNAATNVQSTGLNKTDNLEQKNSSKVSDGLSDSGKAGGSSKVDISEAARQFQMAKEIASKTDDVNQEKVERLQKLIDSGKYGVSADKVADKLVDEHLLMPS